MISLVFTNSPMILSRIIRFLTRSTVSHVMIEYPSEVWGRRWVAEATVGGVRKVSAIKRRRHVHVVEEYEILHDPRPALQKISKFVGVGYDYGGLLLFGWFILVWKIFRRKVKKPFKNTSGQFCSELVARLLIAMHLPETAAWDPERVTPEDLRRYCATHDMFRRLE